MWGCPHQGRALNHEQEGYIMPYKRETRLPIPIEIRDKLRTFKEDCDITWAEMFSSMLILAEKDAEESADQDTSEH